MKSYIHRNLSIALVLFIFLSGLCTYACEGESVIFKTDIADDATPAVLERILKADEQPVSEIKFEKGTYHFYPDKGFEHLCYISNHEDVLARTAFPLFDFENIVIDGQGSTFIFHGRMIPFIIEGGANITLQNFSIDWEIPFHSEGLVVGNDPKNKTIDLKYGDVDSYEIRNGELYFVKEYYEHTIGQNILFDPERRAIAYRAHDYGVSTTARVKVQHNIDKIKYKYEGDHQTIGQIQPGREGKMNAREIEPGVVRIQNQGKNVPPVGTILVSKGEKGLNRVSPAIRVTGVIGFNANNVTVHHANGMAIIAENSENLILDGFNVKPSGKRMLSTTADATHFVGCRGQVVLKNCTLTNQMDDAMNVHGTYQKVMDILGNKTIGIHVGHFEQQMFVIGRPNDKVGVVRLSDSFEPYAHLSIKSIQIINGRYQKITFNENLPPNIQSGDLIENLDAYPEVTVQNCTISRNRARGLLISTPRKTLVENNFFHTQMEAILVPVESSSWFESGSGSNLTIRNNVFQDCNHGGLNRGVIRFHTDEGNDKIAFKSIEITNNKFNQFDNYILEIANTDGLLFQGNSITNSGTFPQLHPDSPVVTIQASKNIDFRKNSYTGRATKMMETDDSLKGLKFR